MKVGNRPPIIDFHAHMLEEELPRQAAGKIMLSGYGANAHRGPQSANEVTFRKMLDPKSPYWQ